MQVTVTWQEISTEGLLGKAPSVSVNIRENPGKGQGVVVTEPVPHGTYICEYKTTKVYPRAQREEYKAEYCQSDEPFDVYTKDGWYCLDATIKYNSLRRLLNHAPALPHSMTYQALPHQEEVEGGFSIYPSTGVWGRTILGLTWGCVLQGQQWLMQRQPRHKVGYKGNVFYCT